MVLQNSLSEQLAYWATACRDRAIDEGWDLSLAESCTGGLIGASLSAIPGTSAMFKGAVVAYDNALKSSLLGVPPMILEQYGAVSGPTVRAMAEGIRQATGSTMGLAATGVAGPTGGSDYKPIGTVFLAMARQGASTQIRQYYFEGNRQTVREATAISLFRWVAEYQMVAVAS